MKYELPDHAPKNTPDAFEYVGNLGTNATIDDLKILALTEALGKELYWQMAKCTDNPEVADLLRANGDEEMVHAKRVSAAIELLTGSPFPIPEIEDNPIYSPMELPAVTRESLAKLAEAEFAGQGLYERVAQAFENEEAAMLFAQNGKEEIEHGNRLAKASALLA